MNFAGLSTDQAPPISVPFRFFLTAPFFGLVAGIFIFFNDVELLKNRYTIDTIIVVHILTIGFFASVMFGALTQMLPVLAGATIKNVKNITTISHTLLVIGLVSMIVGFFNDLQNIKLISLVSLVTSFLLMLSNLAIAIKGVTNFTATVKGMSVSVFFGFLATLLGGYLLYSHTYNDIFSIGYIVANLHSAIAIFGFAGVLIIGVAFQVLPMFYVAPRFKQFCKRYVVILISSGLFLWIILNSFYEEYAIFAKATIVTFFLGICYHCVVKIK
jgi:hypothetical protein